METVSAADYQPEETACLRCGAASMLAFRGPCERCSAELRERFAGVARDVDSEYVPQMNVTPNAVALKAD